MNRNIILAFGNSESSPRVSEMMNKKGIQFKILNSLLPFQKLRRVTKALSDIRPAFFR